MKDLFKKSRQEQEMYADILTQMGEHAVTLGVDSEHVNALNAWQKCDKIIRAYREAEQQVTELGYTSLPIALKALGQFRNKEKDFDISVLPAVFHRPPAIWLAGRPKTKLKSGFAPMRVRDAERQHRVMLPLLIEAWNLADGDPEVQRDIEKEYRNSSAADFERELYEYIYELEEPTLEEQLADRVALNAVEFAEWQEENVRAREARQARREKNKER